MSEIKTRADLFEAAANMMRMCDEAGSEYSHKYAGISCIGIDFENGDVNEFEFPIAILEGRPVFVGDELWGKNGCKHKITGICAGIFTVTYATKDGLFAEDCLSWNPPKPKTVMVEYTIDEAKRVVTALEQYKVPVAAETALVATRKALESSK